MSEENIVDFQGVSTAYGKVGLLNNISFSVSKGEFCYLVGKTGAGKSSIMKLIYADLKPVSGKVTVAGYDTARMKHKEVPFLRRKLGIIFQDFQLLPDRTVFENIRFGLRATGWKDATKIKARANEVLSRVDLGHKLQSMPHQLSGGEQQRVSIARALINDPHILLADEPTGNLDPEATEKIMEILFSINLAGTAVMMATHEHGIIARYPARTLECIDGRIVDHKLSFTILSNS